jgi:hypothetical protein
MLGTIAYKDGRAYRQNEFGEKLTTAYKKAYETYHAACERYGALRDAYTIFESFKAGKGEKQPGKEPSLPYTEKIMKNIAIEADKEKAKIAGCAKECIRCLRSMKYKM